MAKANKTLPAGFFRARRGEWRSDVIHFRAVANGKRRSFTGYTDLRLTQKLRADLIHQLERHAEGLPIQIENASGLLVEHLQRLGLVDQAPKHSIDALVDEWKTSMLADGTGPKFAERQATRVSKIIAGCKFHTPQQINAERVKLYLHDRRQNSTTSGDMRERFGLTSSNHWLVAAKAFAAFLVRRDVLAKNPLASLKKHNAETDIRRQRTILTDAEINRLFKLLASKKVRRGPAKDIPPVDRAVIYKLALQTGLRANELASLTPASFVLEGKRCTVTVEATISKHRRVDVLPLRADMVTLLKRYFKGRPHDQRIWRGQWQTRAAEMLALDLRDAEVPVIDARGHVRDFHALRHTFITRLIQKGVNVKVVQKLARHSTIVLTMKYAHAVEEDQLAAVELL